VLQLDAMEEEVCHIFPHGSTANISYAVPAPGVSIVDVLMDQVQAQAAHIQALKAQIASKEAPGPMSFLKPDDGEHPSIYDGADVEACPPSPLGWHFLQQLQPAAADPAPGSKRPVSDATTTSRKKKVHSVCAHANADWVALSVDGLVHPALKATPDKQSFPEAMELGLSHKARCTECKNNHLLKCSYCPPTIALGHTWPWKNPLRARHVGDAIAAGRRHTQSAHHRFWMAVHHLAAMHGTEEQVLQGEWKRAARNLAHLLSNWESKYDRLGLLHKPESDSSVLFRKARAVVDSLK